MPWILYAVSSLSDWTSEYYFYTCMPLIPSVINSQSLLGRKALEVQLQRIGILEPNNTIQQFESLEEKFKLCMGSIHFVFICGSQWNTCSSIFSLHNKLWTWKIQTRSTSYPRNGYGKFLPPVCYLYDHICSDVYFQCGLIMEII